MKPVPPVPQDRSRSFRLVCMPDACARVDALLAAQGFVAEPEPFWPQARRLIHEPFALGRSLAAFFGYIYIQDRSSMLPPLALQPPLGGCVLDMCASPGSKTGLLATLVGSTGLVVANEPNPARLATLRQNLLVTNCMHTVSVSWPGEALPLAPESFDHILLDPPCSGWGTTDKHPSVTTLWKADTVRPLIALQRRLLAKAARLLQPGGRLVYSTCTTHLAENGEQVRFATEELGLLLRPLALFPGFAFAEPAPCAPGTLSVDEAASQAQGFFVALLEKPGNAAPHAPNAGAGQGACFRQQPGATQQHWRPQDLTPPPCRRDGWGCLGNGCTWCLNRPWRG